MRSKLGNDRPIVQLRKVSKRFGDVVALDDVSIDIFHNEFLSLLGPSGSGKTTTLRLIAGFERPTTGEILIKGESMVDIPPEQRPTNTVFQRYALFPHLSVFDNIAFGLQAKRRPRKEITERVQQALELIRLVGYEDRYPDQLSGGQQQRVALARAVINEPAVLLLDEPLGALDLKLRREMQIELKNLQERLDLSFVYVTHDQEEALSMSDRIIVMHEGRVEQIGSGPDLYKRPSSPFVAGFVGEVNLLPGELIELQGRHGLVRIGDHDIKGIIMGDLSPSDPVLLSIRPENISLAPAGMQPADNLVAGRIATSIFLGYTTAVYLEAGSDFRLQIRTSPQEEVAVDPNQMMQAVWSAEDCMILPQNKYQ